MALVILWPEGDDLQFFSKMLDIIKLTEGSFVAGGSSLMYYTESPGYLVRAKGNFGDVKRFSCPDCNRQFVRPSSLRSHRLYECGKEPDLKCPECAYVTKIKGNLKRHLIMRHREHAH
ncbi:unnamed protein product [Bemisia tabaci]|uniref:C2H2-type domain-containing protein n=1 Tax=Bemisia tabaci TaxID=7038 RepID=A0A9P0C9E5_BEMTA|nr:unnamed protein product [Bemisia tabaci]